MEAHAALRWKPSSLCEGLIRVTEGAGNHHTLRARVHYSGQTVIGWGHVIGPREKIELPLSYERAGVLLRRDLDIVCNQLRSLVHVRLDQHHIDALCAWGLHAINHLAHNGKENWEDSLLLRYLNEEKFVLAGAQFQNWGTYHGTLIPKLLHRRHQEEKLFCTAEL